MFTRIHHRLTATMRGARGVIDLASILIGVVVIGLVGAGILATVTMVIPFAQDEAAKSDLGAVRTAQAVQYTQSAADGGATYETLDNLEAADLIQHSDHISVATGNDGACYAAVVLSGTGTSFWTDSIISGVHEYIPGESESACTDLTALVGGDDAESTLLGLQADFTNTEDMLFIARMAPPTDGLDGFPWAKGTVAETTDVTDVQAWNSAGPISITQTGWSALNDSNGIGLGNMAAVVGDGSEATLDDFIANGRITATIDGIPANTLFIGEHDSNSGTPNDETWEYTDAQNASMAAAWRWLDSAGNEVPAESATTIAITSVAVDVFPWVLNTASLAGGWSDSPHSTTTGDIMASTLTIGGVVLTGDAVSSALSTPSPCGETVCRWTDANQFVVEHGDFLTDIKVGYQAFDFSGSGLTADAIEAALTAPHNQTWNQTAVMSVDVQHPTEADLSLEFKLGRAIWPM